MMKPRNYGHGITSGSSPRDTASRMNLSGGVLRLAAANYAMRLLCPYAKKDTRSCVKGFLDF